jgi:inosine-uridine nucleoside N-ribohydrolase
MSGERIKVILDTDTGSDIDDALALACLLCQPRCDLLGVTTVSGEARPRAEMASALCAQAGRPGVPVHSGVEQALLVDIRQKRAEQSAALGAWPRRRDFAANTAIEFLRATIRAHPGEVVLMPIGPMTNIGVLFALDPELPALLKALVLMCGQFQDAMRGEWNAINDRQPLRAGPLHLPRGPRKRLAPRAHTRLDGLRSQRCHQAPHRRRDRRPRALLPALLRNRALAAC